MQRKHSTDTPLSQTNISLSLSLIQKQCEKLLQEGEAELSLEDPEELAASGNIPATLTTTTVELQTGS